MNKIFRVPLLGVTVCLLLPGVAAAQADGAGSTGSNPFGTPTNLLVPPPPKSAKPSPTFTDTSEVRTCYDDGAARLRNGDFSGALVAFDRLVALQPHAASAYIARYYAKERLKDYAGAINDMSLAIKFDPDNPRSYYQRAISEMRARRWTEASEDLRKSSEKPGIKSPYIPIFLWLVRARSGVQTAANQELAAYVDGDPEFDAPDEWVRKVGHFLLGRETERDFFAAAASLEDAAAKRQHEVRLLPPGKFALVDPQVDPPARGQRCEAWFYSGMMRLLAGDKAAAAEQFRQCLATKRTNFLEYELAEDELKTLEP